MKTLKNITPIDAIIVIAGGFVAFALGMFIYNLITIGIHFQI